MDPRSLVAAGVLLATSAQTVAATPAAPDLKAWGRETLEMIQRDLWLPSRNLYAEHAQAGKPPPDFPSWNWGCGVQLSALAAAASRDGRHYRQPLKGYLAGVKSYWTTWQGLPGFAVAPNPNSTDRYYDDNEWMGLALVGSYDATHDRALLDWAEETFRFVMSGEDDNLGGGIYWRELEKKSKNTCSNGPAAVFALELYRRTRKPDYLEAGKRIYAWTNAHLQDADGLYWDNISLDGKIGDYKWSYNTALMLRANVLLYQITRGPAYLAEARRVAAAAAAHWVDPATGAIRDEGPFAHLLVEAFLAVRIVDRSGPWLDIVRRALVYVHEHVRDANGHYAKPWGKPVDVPLQQFSLIDQASAARAYWAASAER